MKNETILILANNSDGLFGFRHELIEELSKTNRIVVSTPDNGFFDELKSIGCEIIETPVDRRGINPFKDFLLLLRYIRIIKRVGPTRVVTYTIKPNIYGGMACRMKRVPYAANITGLGTAFQKKGFLKKLIVSMYKMALKKAGTVFFENKGNMETLLNERIVNKKQCYQLKGAGVNLERYAQADYPEDSGTEFLFMGRIMREKGVDELFSAMSRLSDENIDCRLRVLGEYEENYSDIIEDFEKKGWLEYDGYQTDVRPYIKRCHCFVLPSWHEGMANTLLEAGAMGRPLITSNIHGCLEAVIDGKTGFLHEAKDPDSLYEAMRRFALLPYEKKEKMARESHKFVSGEFDKKQVVKDTISHLP